MAKILGNLKVIAVLAADFAVVNGLTDNIRMTLIVVAAIALYVAFGGYLALVKEGAISSRKLPPYEADRLRSAKAMLSEHAQGVGSSQISRLKLYLIPGDPSMNAAAYGAHCVSVTRGTLDNADPSTLAAVLGHEVSHLLHKDAEFNRAIFATVTLVVGALSVVSAGFTVIVFLLFLVLNCFRSWLGILAFQGTTKAVGGIFSLFQRGIVMLYRTLLGFVSRASEYRADRDSCSMGYGVQLAYFLSVSEPAGLRRQTLTEALYGSHPPTEKRIARLNKQIGGQVK